MTTYKTSDLKKGLKVQLDGEPYLMTECNFVKPGKGQAMYKCKLKHLIKGTVLDRTWRSDDTIEGADVEEIKAQYLYRQGDKYVFMDNESFEQYELDESQVADAARFLKESMVCDVVLFNDNPITIAAPNHVVLEVTYCEPGVKGDTATNVSKPVQLETGAEINAPAFVDVGDLLKIDTRTGEYLERVKK